MSDADIAKIKSMMSGDNMAALKSVAIVKKGYTVCSSGCGKLHKCVLPL